MSRRGFIWMLLTFLTVAVAPGGATAVEEVLVTGEHPGPGMWKVSSGDHELWILGTHTPLPQALIWKSDDVAAIIAEAQQIIGSYSVSLSVAGADAYRSPDAKLKSRLSRRTWSRWQALRRKYIDRRLDTDQLLPASAAILLQSEAFKQSGLTYTDGVWNEIQRLARRRKVPITTDHQVNERLYLSTSDIEGRAQVGVEYLTQTMQRLDEDIKTAQARANAWATGDIEALKAQASSDAGAAYLLAYSWPFLEQREVSSLLARADANWLAAAEVALTNNRVTFAVLPIYLILQDDGLIAKLGAAGYLVEAPL